jgi:hypothetical protein
MTRSRVRSCAKLAAIPLLMILLPQQVTAQTSLGAGEPQPQAPQIVSPAPTPTPYVPPAPAPAPQQGESQGVFWGALAFTADGSYSSAWKRSSRAEAEAFVLRQCAAYGRGGCEVSFVSGQECVGLATFVGNYRRRRWLLSFTAGGMTFPQAQAAALERCNADERTRGNCQFRTAACADGR